MLPFPRMMQYGNYAPVLPKISYDFSAGFARNDGQISGTISGVSYYPIPNSNGVFGVYGNNPLLTLPANVVLGTGNYTLEATYYLNSTASAYSVVCAFGNLGIRYGDDGFANRLQAATSFNTLPTCYTTSYTRSTTYQKIVTFKIQRISNVVKLYYNGAQINFGTGTSGSYPYSQISDTIDVAGYNLITLGSQTLALINFKLDF